MKLLGNIFVIFAAQNRNTNFLDKDCIKINKLAMKKKHVYERRRKKDKTLWLSKQIKNSCDHV